MRNIPLGLLTLIAYWPAVENFLSFVGKILIKMPETLCGRRTYNSLFLVLFWVTTIVFVAYCLALRAVSAIFGRLNIIVMFLPKKLFT